MRMDSLESESAGRIARPTGQPSRNQMPAPLELSGDSDQFAVGFVSFHCRPSLRSA